MRLTTTLVAAVLVPSAVGLLWWAVTSKAEPDGTGLRRAQSVALGSAPNPPSDTSQEAMHRLENRLKLLELQAQHPAPSGSAAPVAERDDTPGAGALPPKDPWVTANNRAKAYEAVLRAESVDREWSAAMQTRLQEFFRSDMAVGSSMQHVECRSTMCRIEIASQSKTARETFMQGVSSMSPPNSQGFAHIDTDESLEFVVYITRDNHQLPSLEKDPA